MVPTMQTVNYVYIDIESVNTINSSEQIFELVLLVFNITKICHSTRCLASAE